MGRLQVENRITVMQVFAGMGINCPDAADSWSVGSTVASMYAKQFGRQPPKGNRPKTNAPGTHCFALYPQSWKSRIEAVIRARVSYRNQQASLF